MNEYERNPQRIKEVLAIIEKIWNKVPDWRFGQLVLNFAIKMQITNDGYSIEDDELLIQLERYCANLMS